MIGKARLFLLLAKFFRCLVGTFAENGAEVMLAVEAAFLGYGRNAPIGMGNEIFLEI